jgi:hypothetical protein
LGGGVFSAAGTVQDRAQFGEQLGVAELADAGQSGQQASLRMVAQPVADGLIEFGNGGQQGGQQLGLGADDLGEHGPVKPDRWLRGRPEPLQELGRVAAAAVGVAAAERGQLGLVELGGSLRGGELGQEGQGRTRLRRDDQPKE